MKPIAATLLVLILAAAPAARAQEAIQTHSGDSPRAEAPPAPTVGPDRDRRQANGDWARKVMAGETTRDVGGNLGTKAAGAAILKRL